MTNEKGTRHTCEPDELIEHRVKGEVGSLMASKVPVDMDSIFDEGTFENVYPPMVILVEGAFGSGKSTLAYHYCQKWSKGSLGMFELVALVYLRHPAVHSTGFDFTLHHLLLLASDGEEGIDDTVTNIVQRIKGGLKFLLILDGWDEGPACLRASPDLEHPPDNSFLGNLLRSVSSNTTILITSRPDSSVDLHNRPNVKRVEILGFTKESIHDYFHEALSTQLSSTILEDECRKIKDHLANYPAIESSCYIPLNAAILTLLYLQRNRTLPTTHFEMFYQLLLNFIAREVSTRQPKRTLGTISSLDDLPRDLKKQLKLISILAYKGVMNNKIVFTQNELPSILPRSSWDMILNFLSQILPTAATPAQQDLPAMGVLQRVQWAGTSSKTISYNFIHLSIQEMLAAYRISQMGNDQQARVFQTLLGKPRFPAVLQFYSGFTKLTNRGVRNIITGYFTFYRSFSLGMHSCLRCFFEAQIHDQSLYSKIYQKLSGVLYLSHAILSLLDCMSVGYFLAFVLRNSRELKVCLSYCRIDDHSFCLMMRELSKHAEACPAGALHGVTELDISNNKIGDNGIAHIATALQTNTTMTRLCISMCSMSDEGAESLGRALAANRSNAMQELYISGNKIGDNGVASIATALQTNTTMTILDISECSMSDEGAESLARALIANRSNAMQKLYISGNKIGDNGVTSIATALQTNTTMTVLGISACNMSEEGAESLARALAISRSLQVLLMHYNDISDNGIAHIATALQTNNTLKTLAIGGETITDEGALSLAAALTANSSMKVLTLYWSSAHPDSTLKKIGECVSKSTLEELELIMNIPSGEEACSLEEGGKELVQFLEDSHLQILHLKLYYIAYSYLQSHQLDQLHRAFDTTAAKVNMARAQKGLPEIEFWFLHNYD